MYPIYTCVGLGNTGVGSPNLLKPFKNLKKAKEVLCKPCTKHPNTSKNPLGCSLGLSFCSRDTLPGPFLAVLSLSLSLSPVPGGCCWLLSAPGFCWLLAGAWLLFAGGWLVAAGGWWLLGGCWLEGWLWLLVLAAVCCWLLFVGCSLLLGSKDCFFPPISWVTSP